MEAIGEVPAILGPIWHYLTAAVFGAAVIARFLPPPRRGTARWYRSVYALVNQVAQNAGHAKNATAPDKRA